MKFLILTLIYVVSLIAPKLWALSNVVNKPSALILKVHKTHRKYPKTNKRKKQFYSYSWTPYTVNTETLTNDYFELYNSTSNQPIKTNLADKKAFNAFFHLNHIFELVNPHLANTPELYNSFDKPIRVRVNMSSNYDFENKFGHTTNTYNTANTICGNLNKETYAFEENYEIWFHKPKRKVRGLTKNHPLCYFQGLKNTFFCSTQYQTDTALIPDVIYHEFFHLLTDRYIKQCHSTLIGEVYSNFLTLIFTRKKTFTGGTESYYLPPYASFKVSKNRIVRLEELNDLETLTLRSEHVSSNQEKVTLGTKLLYSLYSKFIQESGLTSFEVNNYFIKVIPNLALAKNLIKNIPRVFTKTCLESSTPKLCKKIVNNWKTEIKTKCTKKKKRKFNSTYKTCI